MKTVYTKVCGQCFWIERLLLSFSNIRINYKQNSILRPLFWGKSLKKTTHFPAWLDTSMSNGKILYSFLV